MVFDAARPSYFASSQEGIPDDGTRSCPVDADPSSYGLYDYDESRLADHFSNVVPAADQPFWDGCTQSQLEVVFFDGDCRAHDVACHKSDRAGVMCHPSNAEAWKHFDRMYPDFTEELRNVRLDLCTDGFAPHGQYDRTYSCWKVIITPYNHPPELLIEELLQLWHVAVRTYDHATDRAFTKQATLVWTVNDLHTYGMTSGWNNVDWCSASTWTRTSGTESWLWLRSCLPALPGLSKRILHRPPLHQRLCPSPRRSLLTPAQWGHMRPGLAVHRPRTSRGMHHPAPPMPLPSQAQRLATGGTAMTRACSRSSSHRPRSSCESSLPTPATSWPDRCAWPRRSGASFWCFRQAQNSRHSRPRIRSTGQPTRKQR
ncbi:hypothetical protein Sango_1920400 [Sesamum angolense]|uniref:Uncharacterized protein n=1 Tax=Sesamum angolense TaxID=2727404 RepID=A0AAE1WDX2_9LAMI|nr:hypothetical protein Sango_1920400 [Sesamum angolense]